MASWVDIPDSVLEIDKPIRSIDITALKDNDIYIRDNDLVVLPAQATTSGSAKDFTVPAGVKRITINFYQVSLSGSSDILVQIGPAAGVENTGYDSTSAAAVSSAVSTISTSTGGFIIRCAGTGAAFSGQMVLSLVDGTTEWISSHSGRLATTSCGVGGGHKTLASGPLAIVRVTRVSGDTFDAGKVSVAHEIPPVN